MLHRRYSTEGIVLARYNYGEADRIVTFFSKEKGKVRVIAKGVRKVKSKKRGHLEVFNQVTFSVAGGHDLDIITEVQIIESHTELRKDLRKVSVAYYLVEIINKLTQIDEKNEFLYYFLAGKLHELQETRALKTFRLDASRQLLIKLGFWSTDKSLDNPDGIIESVIERKLSSIRIGRKITL